MDVFRYLAPESVEETLQLLDEGAGGVKVLAGGTDLLVQMKEGGLRPGLVLDVAGLHELRGIRMQGKYVWIGPLTTHWDLADSALIQEHGLALAQGASKVGSPQIRHRGTIGGNIANASPAADTVPPLVVLQAEVELRSRNGSRWLPVESLMEGPSRTALRPKELITGVRFPQRAPGSRSQYEKFGSRQALSIAVASVAMAAVQEKGRFARVRIALGSVSPTVVRATRAEEILTGEAIGQDLIAQATASVAQQCLPIDDVRGSAWYRRQLVEALLARILLCWGEEWMAG
jgi:carbon-monoxide dehydrogenase medium subunit